MAAEERPSLGVPTFSRSRTDDSDHEGDDSVNDSLMSLSCRSGDSSSNPSTPAAGRSQLYKTAMTTRARQRRMRRINRGRDSPGGEAGADADRSFDSDATAAGATPSASAAGAASPPASLPPPPPPPGPPPPGAPRVAQSSPSVPSASSAASPRAMRRTRTSGRARRRGSRAGDGGGDVGLPVPSSITPLSAAEVRDAANHTSIQFQCSNLSGEVEMFSDDGTSGDSVPSDGGHSASRSAAMTMLSRANTNASSVFAGSAKGAAIEEDPEAVAETYREGTVSWQNDVWSDATTPTLLKSGEIFHRKAAASIVSLLSPGNLSGAGLMAPDAPADEAAAGGGGGGGGGGGPGGDDEPDVDGDSPTGVADPCAKSHFTFRDDPGECRGGEWDGTKAKGGPGSAAGSSSAGTPASPSRKLFRDDIDYDVKQSLMFQRLRQRMLPPSSQLSDLLSQIHRRPSQVLDRAFAVRRKNACGALKILSGRAENRIKICWTSGVLPALASVLCDVTEGGRAADGHALAADDEARVRAVSTLLNLSAERRNRMLIANHPGMLESVSQCVKHDGGEGRQGCCTALLYLSKTSEARGFIVRSGGMMDVLAEVIRVPGRDDGGEGAAEAGPDVDFYDSDPNRFLHGARLSVFACLLCLVKSQENAYTVAREQVIVDALVGVSRRHGSPSHARAMAVLAHLTRQSKNCHHLVFKHPSLLPTLQYATGSSDREAVRYAFCALQNLSVDKSCRAPIAHTAGVIWSLADRLGRGPAGGAGDAGGGDGGGDGDGDGGEDADAARCDAETRLAVAGTLQNLSDEPANLIQFTIVKDCIGTIARVANEDVESGEVTDLTQFMAKNALASLSHWFRKIATSGSERIAGGGAGGFPPGGASPGAGGRAPKLFEARLVPTTYEQWT